MGTFRIELRCQSGSSKTFGNNFQAIQARHAPRCTHARAPSFSESSAGLSRWIRKVVPAPNSCLFWTSNSELTSEDVGVSSNSNSHIACGPARKLHLRGSSCRRNLHRPEAGLGTLGIPYSQQYGLEPCYDPVCSMLTCHVWHDYI
jgi:hypothetical protein